MRKFTINFNKIICINAEKLEEVSCFYSIIPLRSESVIDFAARQAGCQNLGSAENWFNNCNKQ